MKIVCMGDSTMQYNNIYRYPQFGWAQVLPIFLKPCYEVLDLARNGRSTKSYLKQGRFADLLERLDAGDYVICQFGHNDAVKDNPIKYTSPYEDYTSNLKYFAEEVMKKGANIIFATPITKHNFVNGVCIESHGEYSKAMIKLCQENNYTLVDLDSLTRNLYNKLGEEESKKFHMIFGPNIFPNYLDGLNDHTHLRFEGAIMVASLFVEEVKRQNLALKDCFLKPEEVDDFDKFMGIKAIE